MLYVFVGESDGVRKKAKKFLDAVLEKKMDAPHAVYDEGDITKEKIEEYISSTGLFGGGGVLYLRDISKRKDIFKFFLGKIKEIDNTESTIILLEEVLSKKDAGVLKKHAKEYVEETQGVSKRETSTELFTLTDAFGARDRKKAWIALYKARMAGKSIEEIHTILFWQTKGMLLVKRSGKVSPATLGMKPYPYQKAKNFSEKYTVDELKYLSQKLVALFHDARFSGKELDIELEHFLLTI